MNTDGVAEKRFIVLVTVAHDESLADGKATDAALAALERIGPELFPVWAEGANGNEYLIELAGLEILGDSDVAMVPRGGGSPLDMFDADGALVAEPPPGIDPALARRIGAQFGKGRP